jgi:hypothetical protein
MAFIIIIVIELGRTTKSARKTAVENTTKQQRQNANKSTYRQAFTISRQK